MSVKHIPHQKLKVQFYSLPEEHYPYLLVNRKNYGILFKRNFEHAIIDSGVMDFVTKEVKEYPKSFLDSWAWKVSQLQMIFHEKVWFVVPDYPDDYNPNQFGDNVLKTLENVKFFMQKQEISWLPVIQSRYLNRFSFLESAKATYELIGDYPRVAIGTVCKCKKKDFIIYCCKVARKVFPHSWIHAFGLTLSALPEVANLIDSFDSMAWTFPRTPGHSCKNSKERIEYWHAYVNRVNQILEVDS